MSAALVRSVRWSTLAALLFFLVGIYASAQSQNILRGRINDPVGRSVSNAKVVALQDGQEVAHTTSNADGVYELSVPSGGRYDIRVEAEGFAAANLSAIFVAAGKSTEVPAVILAIGPLTQNVVVSATGTAIPDSQVGASISVIDSEQIQTLNKLDVLENMRLIPGVQIVQTGQRGGI